MITLQLRLLGGLSREKLASPMTLKLPDGASVGELVTVLKDLGINPDSPEVIISLSGKGLRQYPADHKLQSGEELIVFPNISGGS
jgi:sulfur carrier protein ThiS